MSKGIFNFSYIRPNQLAGSGRPDPDNLQSDLDELWNNGIRAILTLTETPLGQYASSLGDFNYCHIAIRDFLPPTLEQIDQAMVFIEQMLEHDKPVLAHCAAGIGRTGSILSAWLIYSEGKSATEAMNEIRQLRPGSVETSAQIKFIQNYETILKTRKV